MSDVVVVSSKVAEFPEMLKLGIIRGLEAIGITAEAYAADNAPVDTGRLRGSITHIVQPDQNSVIIGTNVEYAIYQELGTSRGVKPKHFLQNAATQHASEYRDLMQQALQ